MQITTLIENEASRTDPDLVSEWGLSLHIAFNDRTILFDAGQSGAFADNADRLSVNVDRCDVMVLSHHHFDHGGGLRRFLEINPQAKVYLAEAPDGECYAKILGLFQKAIGLDKAILSDFADRFVVVRKPAEILPDVFVLPHLGGRHPKPAGNKQLYLKKQGRLVPDDFTHEIVMAIKDKGKLVIFTGCSHNGLLNMVDTVAEAFAGLPIKAVIGGFHLTTPMPFKPMASSRSEVEAIGRSVLNYPIDMTYTGHCTGAKGFEVLKSVMGDRIAAIQTGSCFPI
ncbi:MAG: MBL fold metallo-hydrolase [Desulfobacterales bacterium]